MPRQKDDDATYNNGAHQLPDCIRAQGTTGKIHIKQPQRAVSNAANNLLERGPVWRHVDARQLGKMDRQQPNGELHEQLSAEQPRQ